MRQELGGADGRKNFITQNFRIVASQVVDAIKLILSRASHENIKQAVDNMTPDEVKEIIDGLAQKHALQPMNVRGLAAEAFTEMKGFLVGKMTPGVPQDDVTAFFASIIPNYKPL